MSSSCHMARLWRGRIGPSAFCQSSIVLPSLALRSCELSLAPQQGLSLVGHLEILLWEQKVR